VIYIENFTELNMPSIPKTTPECKRLLDMVIKGLKSNILDVQTMEAARVALKRLRKKRCTKCLEYIIEVSGNANLLDAFAKEIWQKAMQYLKELS